MDAQSRERFMAQLACSVVCRNIWYATTSGESRALRQVGNFTAWVRLYNANTRAFLVNYYRPTNGANCWTKK